MFTGLIADIGVVARVDETEKGRRFRIEAALADDTLAMGESIAVDGCCLTVVAFGPGWFEVELSHETLERTTHARTAGGVRVNLERAMRLGDRLGGHIVQGHVDGVGTIEAVRAVGEAHELDFRIPDDLGRYVVEKGSITLSGISLTVNRIAGTRVGVTIIPHTWTHTTLGTLTPGAGVNVEVDILAKYVESLTRPAQHMRTS